MAEQANDVKDLAETRAAAAEPSTEENNTSTDNSEEGELVFDLEELGESTEENGSGKGPAKEEPVESKTEDSSETTEPEEKSIRAEKRKQQLNNEIRDKVAERNALQREIAELNRQKYEMKSASDLPTVDALLDQINPETGDYYTRTEAKLARIEAERELEKAQARLDKYTEKIVDNRMRLKDEADRALKDFPIFDENSSSYNPELTERADRIAEGLIVKDDKTGEIIGTRGSVYDVYAVIANAAQSAKVDGEVAGRKAAAEMMNNVDVGNFSKAPTSRAHDDEFGEAFISGLLG